MKCKLARADFIAGGPVEMEVSMTNKTSAPAFHLAGETWGRPAYLKFSAQLDPPGLELRDPYPNAGLEPQGPVTTMELKPGQPLTRTVILNQYAALEDARATLAPGHSARLNIRWNCYIRAARKADQRPTAAAQIGGDLQASLTRNDESLRQAIESLAARLINDWNAVSSDPVGRRNAILTLASLRVPEVVPYLVRLTQFPELEVRRWSQHALSELQK